MRLLTVADGYGDSTAVPSWYLDYIKWPELIKLMTRGVTLTNKSYYGAGNEYIVNCVRENVVNQDYVLVQWAQPVRLDLVLNHQNNFWNDAIASDDVYNNNVVDVGLNKFWLSSESTTAAVKEYHSKFISIQQHQLRSQIYIDYVTLLLNYYNIEFKFMLTETSTYLSNNMQENWIFHNPWCGMNDFRLQSKYAELDLMLLQPIPLIFFDFIKMFIMPQINLPWRNKMQIDAVENMLYKKYTQALNNRPNDSN